MQYVKFKIIYSLHLVMKSKWRNMKEFGTLLDPTLRPFSVGERQKMRRRNSMYDSRLESVPCPLRLSMARASSHSRMFALI